MKDNLYKNPPPAPDLNVPSNRMGSSRCLDVLKCQTCTISGCVCKRIIMKQIDFYNVPHTSPLASLILHYHLIWFVCDIHISPHDTLTFSKKPFSQQIELALNWIDCLTYTSLKGLLYGISLAMKASLHAHIFTRVHIYVIIQAPWHKILSLRDTNPVLQCVAVIPRSIFFRILTKHNQGE